MVNLFFIELKMEHHLHQKLIRLFNIIWPKKITVEYWIEPCEE